MIYQIRSTGIGDSLLFGLTSGKIEAICPSTQFFAFSHPWSSGNKLQCDTNNWMK